MSRVHLFGVVLAILGALMPVVARQARTHRDGVYSEEQARRGESLYRRSCSSCHGEDLAGGGFAPELVGLNFRRNWDGLSLNDLADRIRTTMPQDAPDTLSQKDTTDIVAFLLQKNAAPPGDGELSADADVLKQISFAEPK